MADTFDPVASDAGRERGMSDADRAADEDWKVAADDAIRQTAEAVPDFTTDRIWWQLDTWGLERPSESRALGPRMRAAERAGLITATDRWHRSVRALAHRNPKRIWHSNVHRPI